MSINAAHDEEFCAALVNNGCKGVLIGFESLNEENLRLMKKRFNTMRSGFAGALANLRKHKIAVYGTFIFGLRARHASILDEAVDFALEQDMYIAAFNHLTPFPGTPLYKRLETEGRLRYQSWWLDKNYRYNDLPFSPVNLKARILRAAAWAPVVASIRSRTSCVAASITAAISLCFAITFRSTPCTEMRCRSETATR